MFSYKLATYIIVFLLPYLSYSQDTLHLIFAGDIMGHGPQIESAKTADGYDYTSCFEYIQPVLKEADLAIGNLEVTLPGDEPFSGYPNFRSPDQLADALRQAGFDLLFTSNNHSNDSGLNGLVHTIEKVDDTHFYQSGTFLSQEERDAFYPLIIYKNGFKLAFLNYTYGTNNKKQYPPTIINYDKDEAIKADILEAQALKADAIIIMMHWGHEYHQEAYPTQERQAQQILDWGADFIIGAHPHVVQAIHQFKDDNKTKLVAWSLGNFISNQKRFHTKGGILLELNLIKNNKAEVEMLSNHFIPIWRYRALRKDGNWDFKVLPISAYEKEEIAHSFSTSQIKEMKAYVKYLRKHLEKSDSTEKMITKK